MQYSLSGMQLPHMTYAATAVRSNGIMFCALLILLLVASLTFLVWNSVVTLDDEVQYIWTCVMGPSRGHFSDIVLSSFTVCVTKTPSNGCIYFSAML